MKMINEEQARRLAEAYSNYSSIRVSELEYTLDLEIALSAIRQLRKIQDEVDIDMTGMNRHGDDKLLVLEAKIESMWQKMRANQA